MKQPGANRPMLALAAAGVLALTVAALAQPEGFLSSYLFAWLFWLGLSLGALCLHMIGKLTGGRWGEVTAAPFIAAAGVLPVQGVLFLPVLFGLSALYPWFSGHGEFAHHLAHKAPYLNGSFFVVRAILYFIVWFVLARLFMPGARRDLAPSRARRLSALGLVLYALTGSFAMIDWVMSLAPSWYSTVFAAEALAAQLVQGTALGVLAIGAASEWRRGDQVGRDLHDLGNLMLAFVVLWAYLAYSDFLTIWIADLPHETAWYWPRLHPPWQWMGPLLALLLFGLPFVALLFRRLTFHPRALAVVAVVALAGTLLNTYWMTVPSLRHQAPEMHWLDLLTPIALGAVWIGIFRMQHCRLGASMARATGRNEA